MSRLERPGSGSTVADKLYFIKATEVRLRVAEHLQALRISERGVGIVVHRVDDRHPNELFDPESVTQILIHSKMPDGRPDAKRSNLHIVTKETLGQGADGTIGQLYSHFGLAYHDTARLRFHAELVDGAGGYRDDIVGGPTFHANTGSETLILDPKHLDRVFVTPTQELALDDRVYNTGLGDMNDALRYAHAVLDIISDDTVIYTEAIEA